MNWLFRLWSLAAALALVSTAVGCGGGKGVNAKMPPGVAADVGGKTIRESRVRMQMRAAYAAQGRNMSAFGPPRYSACMAAKGSVARPGEDKHSLLQQCKLAFEVTRLQALGSLVQAEWIGREATRHGITTKREVAQALKRANKLARLGSQARVKPSHPPARKDILSQARTAAEYEKLLAVIPVSEQVIAGYAAANGAVFLKSEVRTAQILQTTTHDKARRARQELEDRIPWATIQHRYGIKPFAEHWTGHKTVKKSTAPADAFGRALFNAKRGTIVGPINTLNGWFLFSVTRVTLPRHGRLTPQAHATIANTIRSTQLDTALRKRYRPRTTCARRYQKPEAPQCL